MAIFPSVGGRRGFKSWTWSDWTIGDLHLEYGTLTLESRCRAHFECVTYTTRRTGPDHCWDGRRGPGRSVEGGLGFAGAGGGVGVEARHGFAGARRAVGGFGGPFRGPPSPRTAGAPVGARRTRARSGGWPGTSAPTPYRGRGPA